jgi:hypothetical protein
LEFTYSIAEQEAEPTVWRPVLVEHRPELPEPFQRHVQHILTLGKAEAHVAGGPFNSWLIGELAALGPIRKRVFDVNRSSVGPPVMVADRSILSPQHNSNGERCDQQARRDSKRRVGKSQ